MEVVDVKDGFANTVQSGDQHVIQFEITVPRKLYLRTCSIAEIEVMHECKDKCYTLLILDYNGTIHAINFYAAVGLECVKYHAL